VRNKYQQAFADLPVTLPAPVEPNTRHAYHLYTLLVDEVRAGISRDKMLEELKARNIGCGVHYLSVAEHPFHQKFLGVDPKDTPHATRIGRQTLSLPLSAKLTDQDVSDVIAAVRAILEA
jgi:dTDP-4-amino-4,6-dideoxygalactose transaminase